MYDSVLTLSSNHVAIVLVCYFLTLKIGPTLMRHRQPFNLKKILVYYNCSQIFFNAYLLFGLIPVAHRMTIFCEPEDDNPDEITTMSNIHYKYLFLKFYDLLDTVFFVLRKKQAQITFLHVYHHVLIFSLTWTSINYFPPPHYPKGGIFFFGAVNCFVHAVMYAYYLLSARSEVKIISWKKYVTILQIAQHYVMFVLILNATVAGKECPYPRGLTVLGVVACFSMAFLFTRFYYHVYVLKKEKPSEEESVKVNKD